MVLAGSTLTACVAKWVFPYDWSFYLSMTFGSILAATDPVAVSALLNEVGAPPRLKIHISGESMLNDGSAIVFFTIFRDMYLHNFGILGVGESVGWGEGFAIFFRMAGGGAAVGIVFCLALMALLDLLRRRLDNEENVVQVAATVAVAYLSFYVAEMAAGLSGVISVVMCGITTRYLGSTRINNPVMMESFWILLEHLLNTVLFALGGVVWGSIINGRDNLWTGTDWGYLILLYVLVTVIRFFLVGAFYPILSRVGLGSSWKEAVFLSYGGLRGAVGISLAIALDHEVFLATANAEDVMKLDRREETTKLFGMVGGIAFMTLVINGTLAGPLLHRLGLAKSTEMRKQVVATLANHFRLRMLDTLVWSMTDERFGHVDFAQIRHHVPWLATLTPDELKAAMERHRESVHPKHYQKPNLENILPYLVEKSTNEDEQAALTSCFIDSATPAEPNTSSNVLCNNDDDLDLAEKSLVVEEDNGNVQSLEHAVELRLVFIELVRAAYSEFLNDGQLDSRDFDGLLVVSLFDSLDFATDEVSHGKPLNDWNHTQLDLNLWTENAKRKTQRVKDATVGKLASTRPVATLPVDEVSQRLQVTRSVTFIYAHLHAQENFRAYFVETAPEQPLVEKLVLTESEAQIREAETLLKSFDKNSVSSTLGHTLCRFLLNSGAKTIEKLLEAGLLREREGRVYLESIEEQYLHLTNCPLEKHPGQLTDEQKRSLMVQLGSEMGGSANDKDKIHPKKVNRKSIVERARTQRRLSMGANKLM